MPHFHLFLQASLQSVEAVFRRLIDIIADMGLSSKVTETVKLNAQLA